MHYRDCEGIGSSSGDCREKPMELWTLGEVMDTVQGTMDMCEICYLLQGMVHGEKGEMYVCEGGTEGRDADKNSR